eukprot:TRINITY_DN4755_c0_g1_i1.p1 TRINITY_DN4755_c0_g1~~TRINITY_DN4755_c0_g1_i1.p1  ORF type:complete len:458 (+),score=154.00 TRINITY_DN4755_c0_g1_i1:142-1515(+)
MDELRALQEQFQRVQESSVKATLSSRVCTSILLKLIEEKRIDVYYTQDGKQYVTPPTVEREIRREIHRSGGRVNVVELQSALNLDLVYVERHLKKVIAAANERNPRAMMLVDGEVITSQYLERMMREIEERVVATGFVKLTDMASHFKMAFEVIEEGVKEACATGTLAATYHNPILYTKEHLNSYSAMLRGRLRGATKPLSLAPMLAEFPFSRSLFFRLISGLIKSGDVGGKCQQNDLLFIPNVFAENRDATIKNFFEQNGYIEYVTLARMDIPNPSASISKWFPEGVGLQRCFVARQKLEQLEAVVVQTVQDGEWVDVSPFVPSPLDTEDIELLLRKSSYVLQEEGKNLHLFASCYIVSNEVLKKTLERFKDHFRTIAPTAPSPSKPASLPEDDEDDELSGSGGKKKKKGRRKKKGREHLSKRFFFLHAHYLHLACRCREKKKKKIYCALYIASVV